MVTAPALCDFPKSLMLFLCGHPQICRHLDAAISTISPSC